MLRCGFGGGVLGGGEAETRPRTPSLVPAALRRPREDPETCSHAEEPRDTALWV